MYAAMTNDEVPYSIWAFYGIANFCNILKGRLLKWHNWKQKK